MGCVVTFIKSSETGLLRLSCLVAYVTNYSTGQKFIAIHCQNNGMNFTQY